MNSNVSKPTDRELFDSVIQVMQAEGDAIVRAASRCRTEDVSRAVQLLLGCRGKVIVTGAGKSGIVAKKIAATFSCTGTLALFLHPADAIHGDLGLLAAGDVALLLSNSGESEEVLALVPHLKQRGVHRIALVGNLRSTLARNADVVLDVGVEREACPLNLAPTTSTAVALAMGDGLAMAVMNRRGFTIEDFARNHPGGRIGKRLTLRVCDLMHAGADNPTVPPAAPWDQVIDVLCKHSLGAVNVVDVGGRLLGLITDGDVRRAVGRHADTLATLAAMTAADMMTASPITVGPEVLAHDALRLMENRPSQISVLPVAEDDTGRCLGLLRLHDIVRSGLS